MIKMKQSLFKEDNRHLINAVVPRSPCNQCIKSDVCMYKSDIEKNIKEINDLLLDNETLEATFICKKMKCNNGNTGIVYRELPEYKLSCNGE